MRRRWSMLVVIVGVAVSSRAWPDGLAGLESKLRETGRIGTVTPPATGPIAPDAGAPEAPRDPRLARMRIEEADRVAASASAPPARAAATDEELRPTETAVADCRVEVARRRRVPPSKIAAGSVVLRFTIARTGRVHDAEALSAIDTDLEVAACAKRVLSDWQFAKRAHDAVVVERTYRFKRS